MQVLALTGNIASGKSTVARMLRDLGAMVIDLDAIVHELQRPGQEVFEAIVAHFGREMLTPEGELDRPALRELVLRDPAAKRELEAIVHPAVFARQGELLATAAIEGISPVVVDIPLLFETEREADYDGVILVDAPAKVRRERLLGRGLDARTADEIMAAQLNPAIKRPYATWIIDNDGDLASLMAKTVAVWKSLRR